MPGISFDRSEESLLAKARWFRGLSMEERMQYLCEVTDLILENQPDLPHKKHAKSLTGRVRVLTLPRR